MKNKIKILIVDDSLSFRSILKSLLKDNADFEIIETADSGKSALDKIRLLKPDVVTLDIQMPELSGLDVLTAIKKDEYIPKFIMISSFTKEGGDITIQCLNEGAFDFIESL